MTNADHDQNVNSIILEENLLVSPDALCVVTVSVAVRSQ